MSRKKDESKDKKGEKQGRAAAKKEEKKPWACIHGLGKLSTSVGGQSWVRHCEQKNTEATVTIFKREGSILGQTYWQEEPRKGVGTNDCIRDDSILSLRIMTTAWSPENRTTSPHWLSLKALQGNPLEPSCGLRPASCSSWQAQSGLRAQRLEKGAEDRLLS